MYHDINSGDKVPNMFINLLVICFVVISGDLVKVGNYSSADGVVYLVLYVVVLSCLLMER